MKIAVYAICKNEAMFVDRFCDSMQEADEIYVSDTGSTDDTVSKLEARGVHVSTINVNPWRFDIARNMSLAFVPADFDVCVCVDLDEVLDPGWREEIEKTWVQGQTTQMRYMYTWNWNEDGSPGTTFWYEKIHARKGYRWVYPVHEVLETWEPQSVVSNGHIHLKHYPDPTKSRGQYLPLLEKSIREYPNSDRNMHYLGREYMFYGMYDKSIETLKRHLEMPQATWKDERAASMRFIARGYKAQGNFSECEAWYYRAIGEAPHLREPYYEMASFYYERQNFEKGYYFTKLALQISERPTSYINEAAAWNGTIYDIGAVCAFNVRQYQDALEWVQEALLMDPDNERLKNNLLLIQRHRG
jgi:glycosyltransferase involved in cell wall biosynthesis